MVEKDTYKTIVNIPESILYKDKNSKFFTYAFPVLNENDIKNYLDSLKKKHHAASHYCYAYQIGTEIITYRANDDGEPNNSAGLPIYRQIQAFEVTNILVVVVRYFGGIKLGVGGLVNAYKTAAFLILNNSKIITKTIYVTFVLCFDYDRMNMVMQIIKEKRLEIVNQRLEIACQITISVRKKEATTIYKLFESIYKVTIKKL